jgi:hypothetical protein
MATAAPPKKPAQKGGQGQVRPRSFLIGTQTVFEGGDYDQTSTALTGQAFQPWTLQATGWLAELIFLVSGTFTSAGTPTLTADAPWILFSNIELDDVNNEAVFGPFDGYTWFLANKYGGYYDYDDPATAAAYAVTLGTTSTIQYVMRLPLEIVNRDPIGPVASVNNTAALTLKLTLNTLSSVFATNVPTASSVRVRGTQRFYWEPKKTDKQGRPIQGSPPAAGTTQYWTQGSVPIAAAGTINQQLITGLGYPWRQYIFLYRDASGTRSGGETNWPDPLIGLKFEANMLLTQFNKAVWQEMMSQMWAYPAATMDVRGAGAAAGKENGVYMLNWNADFYQHSPGSETRRSYLVTSPGSNFIFNGAMGASGNLYTIVNYVAPGGGASARNNTAALTGGQ